MSTRIKNLPAIFSFILMLVSLNAPVGLSTDLTMRSYEHRQDFETSDPFEFWTSDGSFTTLFKGLSGDRASSGRMSFKLDVVLDTATYVYFKIPVSVPHSGELSFTGDIYIESSDGPVATLGSNVAVSPISASGISMVEKSGVPPSKWVAQHDDLAAAGTDVLRYIARTSIANVANEDVGIWTDKIGLFILAPKGGRIVLYVDNLHIRGKAPQVSEYREHTNTAWEKKSAEVHADVNDMADFLLGYHGGSTGLRVDQIIDHAKKKSDAIRRLLNERGYLSPDEYAEIKRLYQSLAFLSQYVEFREDHPARVLYTFPLQYAAHAEQALKILPHTAPGFAAPGDRITIKACRGEYEPATFVLRAERRLSDIMISVSDLKGGANNTIPASALDIKLVKCWYQAGDGTIRKTDERVLLPELLLNDDALVKVDFDQKRNFLNVKIDNQLQYIGMSLPKEAPPEDAVFNDAAELQGFSLDAETNKQIWVRVKVPEDAASGVYKGDITIEAKETSPIKMNLVLEVLPFDLSPPILEYGIYYRGKVPTKTHIGIDSEFKSIAQYRTELINIRDHGILYPTLYQPKDRHLGTALSLRNQTGLPDDRIYVAGFTTGKPESPTELEVLGEKVAAWKDLIAAHGYEELYVYGIDEAPTEILEAQKTAWKRVKQSGGRVFAACNNAAGEIVGDLLDVAVISGSSDQREVGMFHSHGKKVLSYGNPQVGIEDFAIYRRNYGIALVCAGYDGAMNYAYQHAFGHIWNDFDHLKYRDHVFAYPTHNGVIDTLQWEGFREAVDDVRYLSTLISLKNEDKDHVLRWIEPFLNPTGDTVDLRELIIAEILKINAP